MFFALDFKKHLNFSCHYDLPNGLILSTDAGWQIFKQEGKTIIAKGYADSCLLEHAIDNNIRGNYCAWICTSLSARLVHDPDRSFPVHVHNNGMITNLLPGEKQIWADKTFCVNQSLEVELFDREIELFDDQQLSDDAVVDAIDEILCETFEKFLIHNRLPLKLFLSEGIDTTTVWCYLDKFTKNYEIIDCEYVKYTPFWRANKQIAKAYHWGYRFIHMWEDPTVLITGSMGDEFFLRGPATMFLLPTWYGVNIKNKIKQDDYMYTYVMQTIDNYTPEVIKTLTACNTLSDVKQYMFNILTNDYQHWHLDNTLTFTPFKDRRILKTMLNANAKLLELQARHAEVNRRLIQKHDPDKLKRISTQKNNGMKNL